MDSNVKLASAGDCIKLWDSSSYLLDHEYSPHNGSVADVSWSHDGQFLASTSTTGDKLVIAYTKLDKFNVAEVPTKQLDQHCVCYSRTTSRHLLTGGRNGDIYVWDLKLHQPKKTYKCDLVSSISKIQFNWNDSVIVSGNVRGEIVLYLVMTGLSTAPLKTPKNQAIRDIKFSALRKSNFATASDDGIINLWDAQAKHLLHSFKDTHGSPAMSLAFSPVNEMLLTSAGLDKRIICYDVKTKASVKMLTSEQPFTCIDFCRDGVTLAAGTTKGKIFVYDLRQTSTPVCTITAHNSSIQCLSFQTVKAIKSVPSANGNRSASLSPKRLFSNHRVAVTPTTVSSSLIPQLACKPTIKKCLEGSGFSISNGIMDTMGIGDISIQENISRLRNLSDEIFSPLRDDSSCDSSLSSVRKQPIGAGKLLLGDRPITAGLEDGEAQINLIYNNNNLLDNEVNERQHSPPIAPRRRSASFSPRTSRNFMKEQHIIHPTCVSSAEATANLKFQSPVSVRTESTLSPLPNMVSSSTFTTDSLLVPSRTPLAAMHVMHNGHDNSHAIFQDPTAASGWRRSLDDAMEDIFEFIQKQMTELRVDMLKEFQVQKAEIEGLFQRYSTNEELLAEIERLREENRRLQAKF